MIRAFLGVIWSFLGRLLRLIPGSSVVATTWGKLGAYLRKNKQLPAAVEAAGSFIFWLFIAVIAAALLLNLIGCTSATNQANAISNNIHGKTAEIAKDVTNAQNNIASADKKVLAATTQPANPPETVDLLEGAHTDLTAAQADLAPIVPATIAIDKKATEAAALTKKVEKKLEEERDHWLGYKTRVALWSFAIIAPILGLVAFVVKTNGGGPLLAAIGSLLGPIFRLIVGAIKIAYKFLFHVFTLGLAKFADVVNNHYDKQQAAKVVNPTTLPPAGYTFTGSSPTEIKPVHQKEPLG